MKIEKRGEREGYEEGEERGREKEKETERLVDLSVAIQASNISALLYIILQHYKPVP
jgi:hypothetical protein